MKHCPKCGKKYDDTWTICLNDKSTLSEQPNLAIDSGILIDFDNELSQSSGLKIQQRVDIDEIIKYVECRNQYNVQNHDGNNLVVAIEHKSSYANRIMLKESRPFTISLMDSSKKVHLMLKRTFQLYFHQMDIYDGNDQLIGRVLRKFHLLNRIYTIVDPNAKEILLILHGPVYKPWTFNIVHDLKEIGHVKKRWGGVFKESLTSADNFTVEYPKHLDVKLKKLILATVFLIDFVHFGA